jgi:Ca2+-binding RTX toxin-like protein
MAVINGTQDDDWLDQNDGVSDADDTVSGLGGNDTLFGFGGFDTLWGGAGNDNMFGGLDSDNLHGETGNDFLDGNFGDDELEGGEGADTFFGGDGIDTATYENSAAGVTVNLTTGLGSGGEAEGDRLFGIENLKGSGHADTLIGNDLDNYLVGNGGADHLEGGLGNDTYVVFGSDSTVVENADAGDDTLIALFTEAGSIKLPQNVETLILFSEDEMRVDATGTKEENVIEGSFGPNKIVALAGDDTIRGFDGDDTLDGGNGKDILVGGENRDVFDFNALRDSLVGSKRDVINDFERGLDDIDLRDIDAKSGGGNQAFKFIGTQQFHGVKGELHYKHAGGGLLVQGDTNGDGHADFEILVKGSASLSAGDLIL